MKKSNRTAYYKSSIGWLKIDGDGNEIVVASSGAIAGYNGGVWRKKWLLEHEAKFKLRKAQGAQN